jgi:hypothetical protein
LAHSPEPVPSPSQRNTIAANPDTATTLVLAISGHCSAWTFAKVAPFN